jgi:hypothetical protein
MQITTPIPGLSIKEHALLRITFVLYALLLIYAGLHHEVWGDEVHSWNIAKGSGSYPDLLANRRYEGHPPAWYTLLWLITRFTHQVLAMQVMQWLIALGIVWIILFKAPLALSSRLLLPFGYYFLFEYGLISRNYALGVLIAFCICLILRKDFRFRLIIYYGLLFGLSNVHLLTLLLAGPIHLYFLGLIRQKQKRPAPLFLHALLGLLVIIPAILFIYIPSDSEVNPFAWTRSWNIRQLGDFYRPLCRAFLPVPAWWNYHFWNTEFLLDARLPKAFILLIAALLLGYLFFILRKSRRSMLFLAANLVLSYFLSVTAFSLNTARHAGFLYIGLVIAWWLYQDEPSTSPDPDHISTSPNHRNTPTDHRSTRMFNILLIIQLIAGVFAVAKDIKLPFSNTWQVPALIKEIPQGETAVTDYWTSNAVVAFTDNPVYCLDVQQELSFVLFDSRLTPVDHNPHRYTEGLQQLFQKNGSHTVYWLSLSSPQLLNRVDTLLAKSCRLTLIDKREGAIEPGSNLYLYRAEPFSNQAAPF